MASNNLVKHYKVNTLPSIGEPGAFYLLDRDDIEDAVVSDMYVADIAGILHCITKWNDQSQDKTMPVTFFFTYSASMSLQWDLSVACTGFQGLQWLNGYGPIDPNVDLTVSNSGKRITLNKTDLLPGEDYRLLLNIKYR